MNDHAASHIPVSDTTLQILRNLSLQFPTFERMSRASPERPIDLSLTLGSQLPILATGYWNKSTSEDLV